LPIYIVEVMAMQISNINVQSGAAEWAKRATGGDASTRTKEKDEKASKTARDKVSDRVSISADAGKSNSAEALVRARANALPEIREEKIAAAKERLESGHYNSSEFSKELAECLVEG
jgi:anti-sigma28 factor (negative regulator of flagellin synthesis)